MRVSRDSVRVGNNESEEKASKRNDGPSGFALRIVMSIRYRKSEMTAVIILLTFLSVGVFGNDLYLALNQGPLMGIAKTNRLTKEPYYAFLTIPYARPPIGEKRFKDPDDPLPWSGVFNATQEGRPCMTYNVIFKYADGVEDCLHLNVYLPKKPEELKSDPLPVMVWIHGGAFMAGSGRFSDYGPDILMQHDVILVTLNYRLNVFGFLSLQNDAVPGNAGLKDQVKALKWVRDNIEAFGGDKNRVTVFGESAGGASVHYLMLSPMAKGLFHRGIAQSGVTLNPWASIRNSKETAFMLGDVFDCNTNNSIELIDCLQQVKAKDLVTYQFNILSVKSNEFLSKNLNLPCIESKTTKNGFLTESPWIVMEEGRFNDVPFMLGVTKKETLLLEKVFAEEVSNSIRNLILSQLNKKPDLLLPRNLNFSSAASTTRAGKAMKEFYFQDQAISHDTIDNLVNATTDSWFLFGAHTTALLHSMSGESPVYFYHFVALTDFGESESPIKLDKPGPKHGDDVKYLFYNWDKEIEITAEEREIIWNITTLWVNFAKFGNPTPGEDDLIWKPFKPEEQNYLEIGNEFEMKMDLETERMNFWDNLVAAENLTFF